MPDTLLGSSKTKELLGENLHTGDYSSKNAVNLLVANILHNVKSPVLCASFAELVANPEEDGEVSLMVQDLLGEGNEKSGSIDGLTAVQISYES